MPFVVVVKEGVWVEESESLICDIDSQSMVPLVESLIFKGVGVGGKIKICATAFDDWCASLSPHFLSSSTILSTFRSRRTLFDDRVLFLILALPLLKNQPKTFKRIKISLPPRAFYQDQTLFINHAFSFFDRPTPL